MIYKNVLVNIIKEVYLLLKKGCHSLLIYYEACTNQQDAYTREKYLKSGMGKRYIKNRLKRFLKSLTG